MHNIKHTTRHNMANNSSDDTVDPLVKQVDPYVKRVAEGFWKGTVGPDNIEIFLLRHFGRKVEQTAKAFDCQIDDLCKYIWGLAVNEVQDDSLASFVEKTIEGINEEGVGEDNIEDYLLHLFGGNLDDTAKEHGYKTEADFSAYIFELANRKIAAGN